MFPHIYSNNVRTCVRAVFICRRRFSLSTEQQTLTVNDVTQRWVCTWRIKSARCADWLQIWVNSGCSPHLEGGDWGHGVRTMAWCWTAARLPWSQTDLHTCALICTTLGALFRSGERANRPIYGRQTQTLSWLGPRLKTMVLSGSDWVTSYSHKIVQGLFGDFKGMLFLECLFNSSALQHTLYNQDVLRFTGSKQNNKIDVVL